MNDCELQKYLPDILDNIFNDYFNIKQAWVYWLQTKDFTKETLDSQVNEFMKDYYILGDKNWAPTTLCSDNSQYQETCKTAKKFIQKANKLVSKIDVINNSGFLDKALGLWEICNFDNNTKENYNLLFCWLYGDKVAPMSSFTNLLYNEMMYYRLFVWYYLWNIKSNNKLLPNESLVLKNNYRNYLEKTFNNRISQTQKTMSTTLRLITDMYTTYPLHIGFLMYHEKLLSFRWIVSKIYTPILTLHDKLQNVQDKK
jgi:hypothetical protein